MSKTALVIIWILLIICGGMASFYYVNFKAETKQLIVGIQEDASINATNELSMFKPMMRFDTNNISYSFVECDDYKKQRMKDAFQIVSNKTESIYFYESTVPKIIIYCAEQKGEKRNSTYVAGEGGPNKVILLDLYPLIVDGKIYLYQQTRKDDCEYPIVEMHELLHVFGFDHINDSTKVLYPYVSCQQRLTEDIISEMKRLYSEKAKADLSLQNLSVVTHGIYIDFNLTITNQGLINSENVSLEILGSEKLVYSTQIGDLAPGISQIINAKNIPTKSINLNAVKFKTTTNTEEYFYENNVLTAS